jgi:hypothetical protein
MAFSDRVVPDAHPGVWMGGALENLLFKCCISIREESAPRRKRHGIRPAASRGFPLDLWENWFLRGISSLGRNAGDPAEKNKVLA